jgi:hypothetical protein
MKKILTIAIFAIGGLLTLTTTAHANPTTVNLTTLSTGSGWSVTVTNNNNTRNIWSGHINLRATNSTNTSIFANGTYQGFCVELLETTQVGANRSYTVVAPETIPNQPGPMGAVKASAIRDLYSFANGAQYASNDYASAFQIAIWEIVNDGPGNLDINNGSFKATNFNAGVSSYLSSLFSVVGAPRASTVNLVGLANGTAQRNGYQDFVVGSLTPEMPGATLALAALLPMALMLRTRRKAQPSLSTPSV